MALPPVFEEVCRRNEWAFDGRQVEILLAEGRRQIITLEPFRHEGTDMVRATSVVGERSALSPTRLEAALGLNVRLPHGALAIRDEQLVLTDTFVAAEADPGEVQGSLKYVAETADRYERMVYGTDEH